MVLLLHSFEPSTVISALDWMTRFVAQSKFWRMDVIDDTLDFMQLFNLNLRSDASHAAFGVEGR